MTNLTSNAQKTELKVGMVIRSTVEVYVSTTHTMTNVENFTVTGFRKAPKGLRVKAQSEFGHGVADFNFEYVPQFPTLSVKMEIVQKEI